MDKPTITLTVNANDAEEMAQAVAALNAKLNAVRKAAPTASADLPLDELVALTRAAAAQIGMAVRVVKADSSEELLEPDAEPAPVYEPKAVKRRGRRSKAEIEAEKAAAQAALAPEEPIEEEPQEAQAPAEAMTDAELELLKSDVINNHLLPLFGAPNGKERVAEILEPWSHLGKSTEIPAKYFPDILKRIGE